MSRYLILNVDDNQINRYLRTQFLSGMEFDVIEAGTGADTLRLVAEEHPDLVLLDVNLPDADGTELCRTIKSDPRSQSIMVLQISASAIQISDAVQGLNRGADGYLIEPVEPELLVAHVRSLLRLRESELALRSANERLQQFAVLATHDLQEPLRVMMLYSQMVENHKADLPAELQNYLKFMVNSAGQVHRLLQDLLAYSRATSLDLATQPVDLNKSLESARSALQVALAESRAVIEASSLPIVEADATGVTQVFQNLLSNAVKYRNPDQPVHIVIESSQRGRNALIRVRDNGLGFDNSYAEQIFGIFQRLHGREVPGSGVGLALCRAIINRLGGSIWAESVAGEGAVFSFTLPLVAAEVSVPARETL